MELLEDLTATLRRIRGEYREMPGLKLTVAQAARLWHTDGPSVERMLDTLVSDGLLRRTPGGAYLVRSEFGAAS
jgi:DNA-binding IclR family transcriptional regulator